VIDNTEYPEALFNSNWKKPESHNPPYTYTKALYTNLIFDITYTSHDKIQFWMGLFTVIFSILGVVTLSAFVYFLRQTCLYEKYALEARTIKREIMKFEDNEYKKFLLGEKMNIGTE